MPLLGDDLDPSTLQLYLKDTTFVEYFNSFLLLPAFSSRLFFDQDTGFFEPVHGEGTNICWGERGGITPSSSQATLYLTDENMGPALDRHQSWSWVVEHRLPLFLRSDIYSEYKLCKLLSTQGQPRHTGKLPSPFRSLSNTKLHPSPSTPTKKQCTSPSQSVTDFSLPTINSSSSNHILENVSSISLHPTQKSTPSKSDIESKQGSTTSLSLSGGTLAQLRRVSMDLTGAHPTPLAADKDDGNVKLSEEEAQLVGSKSGMSSLWKFLRGKAGEKNWLFWLDAERVKYHNSPLDQQRLLRELRERYLHSGGPLELPAEIRNKLRVNKTSRLTLSQLKDLQHALVQGLREYWCPRFLIHHSGEAAVTPVATQTPPNPSTRSYSCTPVTLNFNNGHPSQVQSSQKQSSNYPKISTPLTPTGTPTFRRLTAGRIRSYSSPTSYRKAQEERETRLLSLVKTGKENGRLTEFEASTDESVQTRPHTVNGTMGSGSKQTHLYGRGGHSRRVWDMQDSPNSKVKGEGSVSRLGEKRSHFNRVAKYTLRHVPDTNSRCASRMDGQTNGSMCESRCQILSVSGTPLHTVPPTPTHPHTFTSPSAELYSPLINCLNTEQRKAGGYFQRHLENNEERVFLYCLLFWRDVQEYKALFVGASFSPCTVEMKAKTLYGRFVSESSEECIECPQEITDTVSSNLWPAYEDLFDSAEEHALGMLLLQWVEMVTSEDRLFQKLDSATVSTRLVSGRGSRRGLVSDMTGLEELEEEELYCDEIDEFEETFFMENSRHPSATKRGQSRPCSSSNRRISRVSSGNAHRPSRVSTSGSQPRAISLNDIMKDRTELDHFKVYLNEHYAAQDLMCWMEIEAFRGIPVSDKAIRNIKAKQLKTRYFNKTYLFGPASPATKEAQRQIVQAGGGVYNGRLPARPRTPVFIEAQKHVRTRLEKKWLAGFITTAEFLNRNSESIRGGNGRRISKVNGKDAPTHYETSFANSHEAITFRKMLYDKHQVDLFLRFLDIKTIGASMSGTSHPRQDIEFWLEVQKYKEMCHAHTTDSMLANKATAIIDCYFLSSVPPKLQVDIPPSVADQASRKEQGPYLFREAQAAVFKHLYTCWSDYKTYISGFDAEQADQALDRLKSQLLKAKYAEKDRETYEMLEVEKKKLLMPRFETTAEKDERQRKERERAETGDVHVAFRLSNPNQRYTYYTPLPEDFVEKQVPHTATTETKDPKNHNTYEQHTLKDNLGNKKTKNVNSSRAADPMPMVILKMENTRTCAKKIKKQNSSDFDQSVKERLPMKPNLSNQQMLLEKQAPPAFFHNKRGTASPPPMVSRRPAVRSRPGSSKGMNQFAPHTTISMRMSADKGALPYPYGGGLPKEQSSLSIVNVEAL